MNDVNKTFSGFFDNILENYNKKPVSIQTITTDRSVNLNRKRIQEKPLEAPVTIDANRGTKEQTDLTEFILKHNKFKRCIQEQNKIDYNEFLEIKRMIIQRYSWIYTYIIKNIDTIIDNIQIQTYNNNNTIVIFKHYERIIDMMDLSTLPERYNTPENINNMIIFDLRTKMRHILTDNFDVILYDNVYRMKHKTLLVLKW